MFVRTEHQLPYEQLFRTVVDYTKMFFDVELKVSFGSLDHAAYIANAYQAVWPEITLLNCYAHVARKCREKMGLLNDLAYYHTNIEINIQQMHKSRSPAQFQAISQLCTRHWREDGEEKYADWFEKVYLDPLWARWYVTSAIPGVVPSQIALESHNGVIKRCGISARRSKTGVVLNDSLPGIFTLVVQDAPRRLFGHFCEGPIPSEMVHRAALHVVPKAHFIKTKLINRKRTPCSFFYNTTECMRTPTCPTGEEVTLARVDSYVETNKGLLPHGDSVLEINRSCQSLHEVKVSNAERARTFLLKLEPVIAIEVIQKIRELYFCDCKAFWSTGSLCSHVIATIALMKQFDLKSAIKILPTRKLSGGQRKIPGALYADDPDNRTFKKTKLVAKLLAQPYYPNGWRVGAEFDFTDNGVEASEFITGTIGGFRCEAGKYKWPVKFTDGDVLYYECEELAEMIVDSRRAGLDVTASAAAL